MNESSPWKSHSERDPQTEGLIHLVPCFVHRLLCLGLDAGKLHTELQQRPIEIEVFEEAASVQFQCRQGLFDAVVARFCGDDESRFVQSLGRLLPYLETDGIVIAVCADRQRNEVELAVLDELLNQIGLLRYQLLAKRENNEGCREQTIIIVRNSYNPILHARKMADKGDFGCAIQILEDIPHDLIVNDSNLALISAEKQKNYLKWQKSLPAGMPPQMFFLAARREFAQVTYALPLLHEAYRTEAQYWRHIGNANMSRRTLRSILHADYDSITAAELASCDSQQSAEIVCEKPPKWSGTRRARRLLIVTHDFSDYVMDTLYDGLCRVLGKQNVIEFPWKPTLHGCRTEQAQNYPCTFDYGGERMTLNRILQELEGNRFDFIVYADVVQRAYPQEIRAIMSAGRDLPVVLYDSWDNCYTPIRKLLAYTGLDAFDLFFKREMLGGVDYGPNAIALPFCYSEGLINGGQQRRRDNLLFWAGKRIWGLRPLYLRKIEEILNQEFNENYNQEEYRKRLQKSRIGLSFFGSGFDTVRYWEIPAHGGLLLSERPPIRIAHNFVDGETALFFEDLQEFEEKMVYCLNNLETIDQIAAKGHEHFKHYHTSSARARQFLGYLENFFCW